MLASKGWRGTVRRTAILPVRYGVTPEKMARCLDEMVQRLSRHDVTPTIPTTADILDRHPDIVRLLRNTDPAIHGYHHVPYADLSASEQAHDLSQAERAFAEHGLSAQGFRGPYLRVNDDTARLLSERGFRYDSSTPSYVLPPNHPAARAAQHLTVERYGEEALRAESSLNGAQLVEIPVALPDDEILVDGMALRTTQALDSVLRAMLDHARTSGSLLVLQVHPERFPIMSEAILTLLVEAKETGAWVATLSEIADWASKAAGPAKGWPHREPVAVAVTGDLDALTVGDFAHRLRRP